jgi:hypothetical protein
MDCWQTASNCRTPHHGTTRAESREVPLLVMWDLPDSQLAVTPFHRSWPFVVKAIQRLEFGTPGEIIHRTGPTIRRNED